MSHITFEQTVYDPVLLTEMVWTVLDFWFELVWTGSEPDTIGSFVKSPSHLQDPRPGNFLIM